MGYLRSKALFQCFLLVCSLFTVQLLIPSVEAREDACCEKTLSGDSCVYTASRDCDPKYNTAAVTCDKTSFCQPVCCVNPSGGACSKQVPVSTCVQQGGTPLAQSPNCQVQQCQQGCCQIGNQCSLQTEKSCQTLTGKYPTLQGQDTFDETITNEVTCVNQCRATEEGCCAAKDSCTYTTRGQCTGEFSSGKYCSDASLPCGVKAKDHKGCVEGDDNVYWFDSAGNKESVAEDCDYAKGTTCGKINNNYVCKSLDCQDTQDFPVTNVHDPQMGKFRYNGDSWCVYESGTGEFRDRPGSRQYRHLCVNGEEIVSPCRDYREEVCLQGKITVDGQEHTNAQCIPNQIYDSTITENLSSVQRGFKFWESQDASEGTTPKREGADLCAEANMQCPALWSKKNNFADWKCKGNCFCETQEFIDNAAWYCRSKGDCGATVNILGKRSDDGFTVSWDNQRGGIKPATVSENYWTNMSQYGVYGGMRYLSDAFTFSLRELHRITGNTALAALGVAVAGAVFVAIVAGPTSVGAVGTFLGASSGSAAAVAAPLSIVVGAFLLAYGLEHGDVATIGAGTLLIAAGIIALAVPVIGWVIGAALVVVAVVWTAVIGGAKQQTNTATITCEPWVPPAGGSDCEKCDDDPSKECTEYRCHSLGAACKYLPEDQTCASASPNDVTSPQISPLPDVLTKGFNLQQTGDGYYIQPALPVFTPLTFGIKTDEISQCRISDVHTANYDTMTSFFGSSAYSLQHKMSVSVAPGQQYTYYVRCQDVNGVKNVKEYFIQFSVDQQPDITPPQIQSTTLVNGAYVPVDTKETSLGLFLNEPSQCRWGLQDQPFDVMPDTQFFDCDTEISTNTLHTTDYFCLTQLSGLENAKKNQFYFRCKDLANNAQQESYPFALQGTVPLQIASAGPQGDILTSSPTLQITTAAGAEQGKATCTFTSGATKPIPFFTTGGTTHTQPLTDLPLSVYDYALACTDAAGNKAEQTLHFSVTTDSKAPVITHIYSDAQTLYVATNEPSTCSYSSTTSSFSKEQGTPMTGEKTKEHTLLLDSLRYYITCWDAEGNSVGPVTVIA